MTISKEALDARRVKILNVAYDVFVQNSIEGVSLQNIAESVGMGRMTLFRYFPTKTDLAVAVCGYKWNEYLTEAVKDRPITDIGHIPAIDRLEFTLDTYLNMYKNHKDLLKYNDNFNHYITHEVVDKEKLSAYLAAVNPMSERMHLLYEKGKEDHTIRTDIPEAEFLRMTTHTMMAACQHYAGGFIWGADPDEEHDYTPELVMLKNMIMKFAREGITG